MSGNAHKPHPQGDDDLLQEEENEQEKIEDPSDQDVGQMGEMVKNLGGLIMLKTDRFNKFKNAYNTLTNPKLAENLLDLDHPENLRETQSAIKISRHELDKKGNIKRGYTESSFLFWKSDRLTPDQLYRARYSTILAKRLHLRVNQTSNKNKIEGFVQNFAATDQEAVEIRKSLEKWRKDHPGKSLDEAILAESKRIKKARGEGFGKKEEGEIEKQLKEARGKAVETHKNEASRTADQIKYTLDPKNPAPPASQLRPDLQQIQTGQIAPEKLAGGFAEIPSDLADAIMGYDLPVKKIPVSTPATTPSTPPPSIVNASKMSVPGASGLQRRFFDLLKKDAALQFARVFMRNALAYSIRALRSVGLRSGAKLLLSFAKNHLPFLFRTATRAAITAAGAAASLGTSLVAQAALEALKKIPIIGGVVKALDNAFMGLVKGLAILIIGLPVALIIYILFAGSSLNTIPNYGVQNSMKVSLKNTTPKYTWSDFENNFLVLKKNKLQTANLTWEEFEKDNLWRPLSLLSENK